MNLFDLMLAQTNATPSENVPPEMVPGTEVPKWYFWDIPLDDLWKIINGINWIQAIACLTLAMIFIIYGWRIFRGLVILNFAIFGIIIGRKLGVHINSIHWGGILGVMILGSLAWPFMKHGVSILGACAGGVIGLAIWQATPLPNQLVWVGALAGLIAGAFMAFSSYKISIMLFTSLQGSIFLSIGSLALLNKYPAPNISIDLENAITNLLFLLPLIILIPTFCSFLLQRKLLTMESKWDMPE